MPIAHSVYIVHTGVPTALLFKPLASLVVLVVVVSLTLGTGGLEAATFNVTTNADSSASSLRQAMADASAGDTITFDANLDTITLTTGQIDITKTLTIIWPVADQTIDGNQNGRIFGMTQGHLEKFKGLCRTRKPHYVRVRNSMIKKRDL